MDFDSLFDLNHDGRVSSFEAGTAFEFGQTAMEEEDRRWGGYDPDGKTKDYIADDWHEPWSDDDASNPVGCWEDDDGIDHIDEDGTVWYEDDL